MASLHFYRNIIAGFVIFTVSVSLVQGQKCRDGGISQQEYAQRRVELMHKTDSSSLVAMKAKEAGGEYDLLNYTQDPNFHYLTGIDEPGVYLIMSRQGVIYGGKRWNCLFFAPPESDLFKKQEDFSNTTDTLIHAEEFSGIFKKATGNVSLLFYSAPDISFVNDWLNDKPNFLITDAKKRLKQQYPGLKMKDAGTLIGQMRSIKSAQEIELIKSAVKMTGDGILRAGKTCGPGVWEYELQAAVEYEMRRQGSERVAFSSIIGSGENSLILHYSNNNCKMENGGVVVMDVGAQYHGYAADITRTIPVSGKFTKEQKEIYNIVLQAQKEIIAIIKPGVTMSDMDKKAVDVIGSAGYRRYIQHGVTHPVGLFVHDVITTDTLAAGMVITVEPGIYIPKDDVNLPEAYRGFGVRIEDDVLVTETSCEVLSTSIPKEAEEIEKLMR